MPETRRFFAGSCVARAWSSAVAACLACVACATDNPIDVTAPARQNPPDASGTLAASYVPRPDEQEFADIARVVSSSAGYYLNANGGLVFLVRDAADDAQARRALELPRRAGGREFPRATGREITVRRADYTFIELAMARDRLFDEVLTKTPGFTSLDLDEVANRVSVGLDPERFAVARGAVLQQAARLSIDTLMLVFHEELPLQRSGSAPSIFGRLASPFAFARSIAAPKLDTLVGGISVDTDQSAAEDGAPGRCTVGFVAYYDGYRAFVTASHCTAVWGAPDMTVARHVSTGRIGYEVSDPNKWRCGLNWCRGSDAALFRIDDSIPSARGLIARTTFRNAGGPDGGYGSLTTDPRHPYFIVTDAGHDLPAGREVQRMGQTSGWTWGWIARTCADHTYDGSETGWLSSYTTVCAYTAAMANYLGDSGGPLFTWEGGDNVSLEGIVIGQTSTRNQVFSKFNRIVSDLGGNLIVTHDGAVPPLTLAIRGPSTVRVGQTTCTWTAEVSGGYQPYSDFTWTVNRNTTVTRGPKLKLRDTGGSSFTIRVTVTDAVGTQHTASQSVRVVKRAPSCML